MKAQRTPFQIGFDYLCERGARKSMDYVYYLNGGSWLRVSREDVAELGRRLTYARINRNDIEDVYSRWREDTNGNLIK